MATSVIRSCASRALLQTMTKVPTFAANPSLSKTRGLTCRCIATTSSTPPRRGMITQPLAVENAYYEEDEVQNKIPEVHVETMEMWQTKAKSFVDTMVTDDISKEGFHPEFVNHVTTNQVKSLFEELIEDDQLDPRMTWSSSVEY